MDQTSPAVGSFETSLSRPRWPRWITGLLSTAAAVLIAAVAWKATRTYDPPATPERAFIRQAPVFQLHDSSMKLMRLQRYVGRSKFLVAFVDASQGADGSVVLQGMREA